jgi:hypothetical protein
MRVMAMAMRIGGGQGSMAMVTVRISFVDISMFVT